MVSKFQRQRIRDPLHDLIEFEPNDFENALWNVINTRPFQRLRRIRQLGFSDLTFPGATHSRFAHSVGAFHTARQLMRIIERHLQRSQHFDKVKAETALAAALVHDVGHGPFSHSFEEVGKRLNLKMANHENVSELLIRDGEIADALRPRGSGFANDVADLVAGIGEKHLYGSVVSSQFDADRLDYMRRDRLMTGTQHSGIDFTWLLANLEVGETPLAEDETKLGDLETLVLGPKSFHAAEAYVLGLFQLYPTVYFHKATRGAEKIFSELLIRVIERAKNGGSSSTGIPKNHPLTSFAREPEKVECVLNLDDAVIWGALSMMADADDKVVADLATRLRDRKLYKAIDVRKQLAATIEVDASEADREALIEKSCAEIERKIIDRPKASDACAPSLLLDKGERSPYKGLQESTGPLNQIYIRTALGKLVDIKAQSKIVSASEKFKFFRIYVPENGDDDSELVNKLIAEEAGNVKKLS